MPVLPQTLQQFEVHRNEIGDSNPLQQAPMRHHLSKWREGLASSPVAARQLELCIQFLEGSLTVTRQSIFDAIARGLEPQARFLMQMIWGNVPSDGRAPSNVCSYFRSPIIHQAASYKLAVDDIHAGRIETAFNRLMEVPRLSTSFLTKVLYFESRHFAHNTGRNYALIMDDRVSRGLVKVTSPWAHECLESQAPRPLITISSGARRRRNQVHRAWLKYWSYVEGCHQVAEHLATEGDHIEYFLFNEGSRTEP